MMIAPAMTMKHRCREAGAREGKSRLLERAGVLIVMSTLLAGCSGLGGGSPAPRIFDLSAPVVALPSGRRGDYQIVVSEPVAVRALDGEKIMVKLGGGEISYFGDVTWSDRLPRLVQARMIDALERSGKFRAVGNGRDKVAGDLDLATELVAFETAVPQGNGVKGSGSARATVTIVAKLVDDKRGSVVALRRFTAEVAALDDNPVNGVAAMNEAFHQAVSQLVAWAASVKYSRDVERELTAQ